MSLASVLQGLAGIAGQGFQGYAIDKQTGVKDALARDAAAREAERSRILNLLTQRQIAKPQLGDTSYAPAMAEVKGAETAAETPALVSRATAMAPIHVKQAADTATAVAPIDVKKATDIAAAQIPIKATEAENAAAASERHAPPIPVANKDGSQTLLRRADAVGQQKGGGSASLPAPMAAKVGQFGEMLKKAHDLTNLTDNLDVSVGQSATRDLAEHGVHIPFFGTVPGTKGLGSALMSHSPEYAQYQAALSPFILAAAHALSGARINQDQVEQIRKSIELAPGDFTNKSVREQKEKNLIDLINSIGGSLPHDAISAQEAQMDESSLMKLVARGYRRIGAASVPTASVASDPEFDALMAKHRKP